MRTSSRFLRIASICSLLSIELFADEPEKIADLIPADLTGWTIEHYERCVREGSDRAILDSHGKLLYQRIRGYGRVVEEKQVAVPLELVAAVFQSTRGFFNHYQMKDLPRKPNSDVEWLTTIRDGAGHRIEIVIDSFKVDKSPEVLRVVHQARQAFGKHGFGRQGLRYEYDPDEDKPLDAPPSNRLPEKLSNWSVKLFEGISDDAPADQFDDTAGLWLSEQVLRFVRPTKPSHALTMTAADKEFQDKIARRVLNRFQLRNRSEEKSSPKKLFDIVFHGDTDLAITCDRQTLIDAGVLEELDAWVKDINRRFEEQGIEKRFDPPWKE